MRGARRADHARRPRARGRLQHRLARWLRQGSARELLGMHHRGRWCGPISLGYPDEVARRSRGQAQTPRRDSPRQKATLRRTMNDAFDAETLRLLDQTKEVRIETRRDGDSPEHRTIIWVVVVEGEVFVRSVRGQRAAGTVRYHRTLRARCTWRTTASVQAAPATEAATVDAMSAAFRSKYQQSRQPLRKRWCVPRLFPRLSSSRPPRG